MAASRGSADDAQQREQGQQQQPGERGDGVAKGHRKRLRPESARVNVSPPDSNGTRRDGGRHPGRLVHDRDAMSSTLDPAVIESWHAHVYFDASSRDAALALRATIEAELAGRIELGRFHEKPVGPHPMWSYQLAFPAAGFAHVVGWLALNHGALDVFVHPNTGEELRDHRDRALWLGRSYTLDLSVLR